MISISKRWTSRDVELDVVGLASRLPGCLATVRFRESVADLFQRPRDSIRHGHA
jgi:hypothetical protein